MIEGLLIYLLLESKLYLTLLLLLNFSILTNTSAVKKNLAVSRRLNENGRKIQNMVSRHTTHCIALISYQSHARV